MQHTVKPMLKIFRSQSSFNWTELTSFEQIDKQSIQKNVGGNSLFAIFKHSTRCSISSVAKRRMESGWEKANPEIPVFYLDLIQYRELSNQIASHFEVSHQSPQLILIKNGEAVYQNSHLSINPKDISNYS